MAHLPVAASALLANTTGSPIQHATIWPVELLHSLALQHFIPLVAVAVWLLEYKRRSQASSESDSCQRLFRQLMPELLALVLLTGVVAILLVCRREDHSIPVGDAAWNDVKSEWPLLMTADTLIGMQAMVRLVFLLSASFRRTDANLSPLDGEPAAFFLMAAVVRVALLILSPKDVYHLDGPLGGDMNVALEVTACLLLLPLGARMLQKGLFRVLTVAVIVTLLAGSARRNHFALADATHSHLDMLFSLVFLLEIVAGVAFYINSAKSKECHNFDAFTGFAHLMLPLQQALPTYFVLVAFAPPFQVEPSLVGKGRPFEMLQAGGMLQLVMYLLAGVMYSASCAEEKQVSAFATLVPASEAPPADECVICLGSCEGMCQEEALKPHWRRLKCGHHFHSHCILTWLKKADRCPMCRQHICSDTTKKLACDNISPAEALLAALPPGHGLTAMTQESVPLLNQSEVTH